MKISVTAIEPFISIGLNPSMKWKNNFNVWHLNSFSENVFESEDIQHLTLFYCGKWLPKSLNICIYSNVSRMTN